MNQQDETSSANSSSGGRGPVDSSGGFVPPPPPPPGYGYAPPPAYRERRGIFASLRGFIGALAVALAFIAIGYYAALFAFVQGGTGVSTSLYRSGDGEEVIAIIPIFDFIGPEMSAFVHDAVETALADSRIKAIVLRVESGGGLVGASDEIAHELSRLQTGGKPIVASFGDVAASGGYYVAAGSDMIIAQPTALTGSIGVMAQVLTLRGLLADKLGITPEVLAATTSPDKTVANDIMRDWTEQDRAEVRGILDIMHQRFMRIVKEGRGDRINEQQLADVVTGKVFMADEALKLNLIDRVGYLDDALAEARDRGGIAAHRPPVIKYGPHQGLLESLAEGRSPSPPLLDLNGRKLLELMHELASPQMLYLYQPR